MAMFKVAMLKFSDVTRIARDSELKGCTTNYRVSTGILEVFDPSTKDLILAAIQQDDHCGMWACRYDPRRFHPVEGEGALVLYQRTPPLDSPFALSCSACGGVMTQYVNDNMNLTMLDGNGRERAISHGIQLKLVGYCCEICGLKHYFERSQWLKGRRAHQMED